MRQRRVFELTADFEFATQAFIDGAEAVTELRAASFMGVLRFWWRALAWRAVCNLLPDGTHSARLATLRAWEDALFGATRTGSGVFTMMVEPTIEGQQLPTAAGADVRSATGTKVFHVSDDDSLAYVTGVWVRLQRRRSIPGSSAFRVRFLSRRDLGQGPVSGAPSLVDAIRVLGLIGGMGARSRRGFGSLVLTGLGFRAGDQCMETLPIARTRDEYCTELAGLLEASGDSMPPFTAYGPGARILLQTTIHRTAASAQAAALLDMRASRSYLNIGSVGGIVRSSDAVDGHDWFKQATSPGWLFKISGSTPSPPLGPLPQKVVFGLPLGFFSVNKAGDQSKTTIIPSGTGADRRASPLLLHIHRVEGGYVAAWVFIPAVLLREDVKVKIINKFTPSGGEEKKNRWDENCCVDLGAVDRFIGQLVGTKRYSIFETVFSDSDSESGEVRS